MQTVSFQIRFDMTLIFRKKKKKFHLLTPAVVVNQLYGKLFKHLLTGLVIHY